MRRADLIYNPVAGRRRTARRAEKLAAIFAGEGWRVETVATTADGVGIRPARDAAERGLDAVLALGGDGTMRECAAGVLGSDTAVGYLPSGTTNVMSLALGLPGNPFRAARRLARGRFGTMDAGLCGSTPFLMQASVGIDAAVIAGLDPRWKKVVGKGAVLPSALTALARYPFPRFELEVAGRRREATFAAICNIPYYGGPWKMTTAGIDDGRLHAVLFSGRGRRAILSFAASLLFRRHARRKDVEIVPLEEIELPAIPELPLQMDGDAFAGLLPAKVRLAPKKLRLLLP